MLVFALILLVIVLTALPADARRSRTGDEFLIGAWSPPPPAYTTDTIYAQMAAAGFNLVVGGRDKDAVFPDHSLKVLDLGRRHGIKCIVRDPRIHFDPQTDADKAALDQMIADYGEHPALYGYFVLDEPNPEQYAKLVEIHQYLAEKDPAHVPYINLYPMYGGPHQIGFDNYDGYIQEFIRLVHPWFISYDHYNFKKVGERTDFFENLEITRRESLKEGIPLWFIIQALQDATRFRPPTLNQMYWQINAALAYGAKAIFYFPYWSSGEPDKPEEWHYIGVFYPDGTPAPKYEMAKEINPQLKKLGPTLMGLTSVSVGHLGEVPQAARGFKPDDLVAKASGDQIILARFTNRQGDPVLMLVNRDWDNPGEVQLTLSGSKTPHEAGRIGPGQPLSDLKWNAAERILSLTLAPGEGRLINLRP